MATWKNLQDALSTSGSAIGPARTISVAAKGRVQAAVAAAYPDDFPTADDVGPDDVSAWLGRQLSAFVRQQEDRTAVQALTPPTELDDTV